MVSKRLLATVNPDLPNLDADYQMSSERRSLGHSLKPLVFMIHKVIIHSLIKAASLTFLIPLLQKVHLSLNDEGPLLDPISEFFPLHGGSKAGSDRVNRNRMADLNQIAVTSRDR